MVIHAHVDPTGPPLAAPAPPPYGPDPGVRRPVVIAHRGASGYRPEHTLAAYDLAIEMGAEFVEPDLVCTRDGVLVARHEVEIGETTDVAAHPEFARRWTTKRVGGHTVSGWFVEDFTLAELRRLRAVERMPRMRSGNTRYDGRFAIATFAEILDLVELRSRERGEVIGVYPELKEPSHLLAAGLDLVPLVLAELRARHLDRPNAPVMLQCFEVATLHRLAAETTVPLVQLVEASGAPHDLAARGDRRTFADLRTPAGLAEVATYADAVGVHKHLVLARRPDGSVAGETDLVAHAHGTGLLVHVWTLRDENRYLPRELRSGSSERAIGRAADEHALFLDAGVDGIFSDFTDTAVAARHAWLARREHGAPAVPA